MWFLDLKVGQEIYIKYVGYAITGYSEIKQVTVSGIDFKKRFIEYMDFNEIADREIKMVAWFDDIFEINTHNKWLFEKFKTLKIKYDKLLDSNIIICNSFEKFE